jgi:menaquinone-dependent protoporphyrinogen oxidase
MKVLVAYASRHGSTQGIAERIAGVLERRGFEVSLQPASSAESVEGYDAFVIGGAAYMGGWLKEAGQFVRIHRELLATRPVWLFSSGPIGPDRVDKSGRDVLESTRPREFAEFDELIYPRDMRVFFGAFDPAAPPVGFAEKVMSLTPARSAMPSGDFREWPAIEAWAEEIALALEPATVG